MQTLKTIDWITIEPGKTRVEIGLPGIAGSRGTITAVNSGSVNIRWDDGAETLTAAKFEQFKVTEL